MADPGGADTAAAPLLAAQKKGRKEEKKRKKKRRRKKRRREKKGEGKRKGKRREKRKEKIKKKSQLPPPPPLPSLPLRGRRDRICVPKISDKELLFTQHSPARNTQKSGPYWLAPEIEGCFQREGTYMCVPYTEWVGGGGGVGEKGGRTRKWR